MSFAANLALKMGCILVILAAVSILMGTLVSVISALVPSFEGSIPVAVASYLQKGRELANNFIPATLFNLCFTAWFLSYPVGLGLYVAQLIQARMMQI